MNSRKFYIENRGRYTLFKITFSLSIISFVMILISISYYEDLRFQTDFVSINYAITEVYKVPLALLGSSILIFSLSLSYYRSKEYERQNNINRIDVFRKNYLELCEEYVFTVLDLKPKRYFNLLFQNGNSGHYPTSPILNKKIEVLLKSMLLHIEATHAKYAYTIGHFTGIVFLPALQEIENLLKEFGNRVHSSWRFRSSWVELKSDVTAELNELIEFVELISNIINFKDPSEISKMRELQYRFDDNVYHGYYLRLTRTIISQKGHKLDETDLHSKISSFHDSSILLCKDLLRRGKLDTLSSTEEYNLSLVRVKRNFEKVISEKDLGYYTTLFDPSLNWKDEETYKFMALKLHDEKIKTI